MKQNLYFLRGKIRFALDVDKCPKSTRRLLHACAPISELPSNISTMGQHVQQSMHCYLPRDNLLAIVILNHLHHLKKVLSLADQFGKSL